MAFCLRLAGQWVHVVRMLVQTKPHEGPSPLDPRTREALVLAGIPAHYSPLLHVLGPTLMCACVIAGSLAGLQPLGLWELGTVPLTYLGGLALEWRVHKSVLHRRVPVLATLYERHERSHHVIYTADAMEIRAYRELALVLLPWFAIVLIVVAMLPLTWLLAQLVSRNVACLFLLTSTVFFLQYEWFHMAYHLPAQHPIAKLRLVRALATLHRRHHDPRNMKRWNFSITIPLFDVLHQTLLPAHREARIKPAPPSAKARAAAQAGRSTTTDPALAAESQPAAPSAQAGEPTRGSASASAQRS